MISYDFWSFRVLLCLAAACGPSSSPIDGGVAEDAVAVDTQVAADATGPDATSDVAVTIDVGAASDAGTDAALPSSFRSLRLPENIPFDIGPRDEVFATDCAGPSWSSAADIRSAIIDAEDGACVRVEGGEYDLGAVALTAANVSIVSVDGESVVFSGATHIRLEGPGATVEGIEFLNGDAREEDVAGIYVGGDDAHISHVVFRGWGSAIPDQVTRCIDIYYGANGLEVSDSTFTDIYGMTMIQPQRADADFVSAKGIWIHHNTWVDNPRRTFGNGGETIQLGTAWAYGQGQPGASEAYDDSPEMIFEHNLIRRHDLEGEIIGLKSSQNIIRYNHFDDCEGAIVVRMGLSNLIYGNWMTDVDIRAVRISGERNVVAYNYFAHKEGESHDGVAVSFHSEDRRENSQPQNVNHYWAGLENVIERNVITGFAILVDGANQRFEVFETPNGNRIEHNYLLGMSANYEDTYGNQSEEEFVASNTLENNYELSADGPRWQSAEDLEHGSVDVSAQMLLWDGAVLPPPTWWSSLDFAP